MHLCTTHSMSSKNAANSVYESMFSLIWFNGFVDILLSIQPNWNWTQEKTVTDREICECGARGIYVFNSLIHLHQIPICPLAIWAVHARHCNRCKMNRKDWTNNKNCDSCTFRQYLLICLWTIVGLLHSLHRESTSMQSLWMTCSHFAHLVGSCRNTDLWHDQQYLLKRAWDKLNRRNSLTKFTFPMQTINTTCPILTSITLALCSGVILHQINS